MQAHSVAPQSEVMSSSQAILKREMQVSDAAFGCIAGAIIGAILKREMQAKHLATFSSVSLSKQYSKEKCKFRLMGRGVALVYCNTQKRNARFLV